MSTENPNSEKDGGLLLPKWAIPIFWAAIVFVIQIVLPWGAARIGPRWGWTQQGAPGWWNLLGLAVVFFGIGMYAWCLVFHYRSYRTAVRVGFTPPHIVTAGPYQISRNPMYVSGLFAWLGWAIFYGSPAVFAALVLLWAVFTLRVIPQEEEQLEALFGDEYREYKRSVRRWFGRY
jgi:protein-S-isoprenylcysteine O-methyltransferase Ste14